MPCKGIAIPPLDSWGRHGPVENLPEKLKVLDRWLSASRFVPIPQSMTRDKFHRQVWSRVIAKKNTNNYRETGIMITNIFMELARASMES
ncbi:hypothetical protein TWF281_002977 [Arthrobotrys megalospora]